MLPDRHVQQQGEGRSARSSDLPQSAVENLVTPAPDCPQSGAAGGTQDGPDPGPTYRTFADLSDDVHSCPESGEPGCNQTCPHLRLRYDGQDWPAKPDYITRAQERCTPLDFVCAASGGPLPLGRVGGCREAAHSAREAAPNGTTPQAPVAHQPYLPVYAPVGTAEFQLMRDQLRYLSREQLQTILRETINRLADTPAPSTEGDA